MVWLLVLASLLGGLVALNVAALRASMDMSRMAADAQGVQQANRGLRAEVASLTAPFRIDRQARALGMVQLTPQARDYLRMGRAHHRSVRAFAR
jgi:hypothetical protein